MGGWGGLNPESPMDRIPRGMRIEIDLEGYQNPEG
jgi:hypothetical protein